MKHACLVVLLASAAAIGPFGKKKQAKIGGAASALDQEIALLDAQIDAQTRKLRALRALRRSGAPAPAAGDDVCEELGKAARELSCSSQGRERRRGTLRGPSRCSRQREADAFLNILVETLAKFELDLTEWPRAGNKRRDTERSSGERPEVSDVLVERGAVAAPAGALVEVLAFRVRGARPPAIGGRRKGSAARPCSTTFLSY